MTLQEEVLEAARKIAAERGFEVKAMTLDLFHRASTQSYVVTASDDK